MELEASLSLSLFFFWHKTKGPSLCDHVLIDNNDLISFIVFYFFIHAPFWWTKQMSIIILYFFLEISFTISCVQLLDKENTTFWLLSYQRVLLGVWARNTHTPKHTHTQTHGNPQHAHINCGNCFLLMCNQEAGRPFTLKNKRRNLSAPAPMWPSWLIPTAHGQPVLSNLASQRIHSTGVPEPGPNQGRRIFFWGGWSWVKIFQKLQASMAVDLSGMLQQKS